MGNINEQNVASIRARVLVGQAVDAVAHAFCDPLAGSCGRKDTAWIRRQKADHLGPQYLARYLASGVTDVQEWEPRYLALRLPAPGAAAAFVAPSHKLAQACVALLEICAEIDLQLRLGTGASTLTLPPTVLLTSVPAGIAHLAKSIVSSCSTIRCWASCRRARSSSAAGADKHTLDRLELSPSPIGINQPVGLRLVAYRAPRPSHPTGGRATGTPHRSAMLRIAPSLAWRNQNSRTGISLLA